MDVSVVIPNLNSSIIDKVLLAVLRQNTDLVYDVTVVGIDKDQLILDDPKIRSIDTNTPVPPGIARNIGVASSSGELIIFLDADCIVDENFIGRHKILHDKFKNCLVGGSVLFPKSGYLQLCDNVSTFHEYMPHLREAERRVLPTLNLSLERKAWDQLGGFLSYAAGEDAEFAYRARKHGMRLIFSPEPLLFHQHNRASLTAVLMHAWRFGRFSPILSGLHGGLASVLRMILFGVGAPIIALLILGKIILFSELPIRYWHTLPVVFLSKLAWSLGMANHI